MDTGSAARSRFIGAWKLMSLRCMCGVLLLVAGFAHVPVAQAYQTTYRLLGNDGHLFTTEYVCDDYPEIRNEFPELCPAGGVGPFALTVAHDQPIPVWEPGWEPEDYETINYALINFRELRIGNLLTLDSTEATYLKGADFLGGYCPWCDYGPPFLDVTGLDTQTGILVRVKGNGSYADVYFTFPDGRVFSWLVGQWEHPGATISELSSLTLKESIVAGCRTVTGVVSFVVPAPPEGYVVSLSDTLASASMPVSLNVLAGATNKSFTIKTTIVDKRESGSVTATLGGTSLSQGLTVRPIGVSSIGLTPTTVAGSQSVKGKATLECKAGAGPITVDLSSSNAGTAYPVASSIVVPQGLQSIGFDVATNVVLAKSYATISGTANGITKSKKLTIVPAAVVSPGSLKFGNQVINTSVTKTVTLSNKGAVPYSLTSISLAGASPQYYKQTNDCPATLAPGSYCTISVTFTPTVAAYRSAYLVVSTTATSLPIKLLLAGTGI